MCLLWVGMMACASLLMGLVRSQKTNSGAFGSRQFFSSSRKNCEIPISCAKYCWENSRALLKVFKKISISFQSEAFPIFSKKSLTFFWFCWGKK